MIENPDAYREQILAVAQDRIRALERRRSQAGRTSRPRVVRLLAKLPELLRRTPHVEQP